MKVEHVRMRVAHEPLNAELVDMELIELKFIFDRSMYCLSHDPKRILTHLALQFTTIIGISRSSPTISLDASHLSMSKPCH